MPAAMIDNRQGITASWAFFKRHTSPIAGFRAIARSDCAKSVREKLAEALAKEVTRSADQLSTLKSIPNLLMPFGLPCSAFRHPTSGF